MTTAVRAAQLLAALVLASGLTAVVHAGADTTVADAYLFTVTRWSPRVELDLSPFPNVGAFMERVAARPKVKEALEAEGLA